MRRLPRLLQRCRCGSGVVYATWPDTRTRLVESRICRNCWGTGYVPTEAGRAVLELLENEREAEDRKRVTLEQELRVGG